MSEQLLQWVSEWVTGASTNRVNISLTLSIVEDKKQYEEIPMFSKNEMKKKTNNRIIEDSNDLLWFSCKYKRWKVKIIFLYCLAWFYVAFVYITGWQITNCFLYSHSEWLSRTQLFYDCWLLLDKCNLLTIPFLLYFSGFNRRDINNTLLYLEEAYLLIIRFLHEYKIKSLDLYIRKEWVHK